MLVGYMRVSTDGDRHGSASRIRQGSPRSESMLTAKVEPATERVGRR